MTDAGEYDLGEPATTTKPRGSWMICVPPLLMVAVFAIVMWHRNATYDELAAEAAALKDEGRKLEKARDGFVRLREPATDAECDAAFRDCDEFHAHLFRYQERLETLRRRVRRLNFHNGGPTGQPPIDIDGLPDFRDDP